MDFNLDFQFMHDDRIGLKIVGAQYGFNLNIHELKILEDYQGYQRIKFYSNLVINILLKLLKF